MKKPVLLSILFSFSFFYTSISQPGYFRCGVDSQREHFFKADPSLYQKRMELEAFTRQWIHENQFSLSPRSVITIPVVVHVVWHEVAENISEEQINSQIDVLNQDLRSLNSNLDIVPPQFQPFIADTEIEFCLAKVDPQGNPTNGITRTFTDNPGIGGSSTIHFTSLGGHDAWDTEHYLNIWVANFSGAVNGIGTFPGEAPPGEDGIVVKYNSFGTLNTLPPYHLGRTTTHEIGHYFNLEHLWGPSINSGCDEDDFVDDTPVSSETYLSQCPAGEQISCGTADMFMNYMTFADDACMALFTLGQKARMMAALNGPRAGLLASTGCVLVSTNEPETEAKVKLFPNPASSVLYVDINFEKPHSIKIELLNAMGQQFHTTQASQNSIISINTAALSPGIYFLKFEKGEQVFVKKVILVK